MLHEQISHDLESMLNKEILIAFQTRLLLLVRNATPPQVLSFALIYPRSAAVHENTWA